MVNSIINIKDVSFSYQGKRVFQQLNLQIRTGCITAIIGPSGVGKSTLLRLISAQNQAQSGLVEVMGMTTKRLSKPEKYQLRKQMGMLFQYDALLTDLTVFDNVAYPLREHTSLPEPQINTRVMGLLKSVGLHASVQLMPEQLSGGMSRRVAFARAIALRPKLMLYDEPFTGQDPKSKAALLALIESRQRQNVTSLLVSHDIRETFQIADDVCILSEAGEVETGSVTQIQQSQKRWVREFLYPNEK